MGPNEPRLSPEEIVELEDTLGEFRNAFSGETTKTLPETVLRRDGGRRLFWRPTKKPKKRLIGPYRDPGAFYKRLQTVSEQSPRSLRIQLER
jgi:hypothetical protein